MNGKIFDISSEEIVSKHCDNGKLIIPNGYETIKIEATTILYSPSIIKQIFIPKSVKEIKESVFSGFTKLTAI